MNSLLNFKIEGTRKKKVARIK